MILQPSAGSRRYRRGALLGFTVAEIFVLATFLLLMLVVLRSAEAERAEIAAGQARFTTTPIAELAEKYGATLVRLEQEGRLSGLLALDLDPEELRRIGALERLGELLDALAAGGWITANRSAEVALRRLLELPPEVLAQVLEHAETFDKALLVDDALRKGAWLARAGDEAEIVKELSKLPSADRSMLAHFAAAGGLVNAADWIGWLDALRSAREAGVDPALAARATELARDEGLAQIEAALAARRSVLDQVETAMAAAGRKVASAVVDAVGPRIADSGGEIDGATGVVTLPETGLFAQSSAIVSVRLDALLREICVPWLTALRTSGVEIGEVRVEGHASSEWQGEPDPQLAFLNNLDLSQRRASAVVARCLALTRDSKIGEWARGRMVAVGHSSARAIRGPEGREDAERSRRVVFRAEVDRANVLSRLDTGVSGIPTQP